MKRFKGMTQWESEILENTRVYYKVVTETFDGMELEYFTEDYKVAKKFCEEEDGIRMEKIELLYDEEFDDEDFE